ncbi:RteC domain-containing protein [Flavobacterium sp.]|uniref:RteC domain-containing protein n=1 Tax=Flavobacterium sp. TaxID=239 RepID=UPI002631D35C|nr:RteC domain-containing protein [Flavobacterium sp.]
MKKFSETLISELEAQLKLIHSESDDPIEYAEQAIKVVISLLEKLKTFFMKHRFESKLEEVIFFRDIKPQFASWLIYYNDIYNITTNKPFGSKKVLRKYYTSELKKLKSFFDENAEFYKYYRAGNRYLDNKYFIRGKHDIRLTLDSFYFQADNRFSTSHDYKVARILANDLIKKFVENEMALLDGNTIAPGSISGKKIKWTGSKVALVELIYALHSESVFNKGNADLKETIRHFENMFDIDLGQFNRTFLEIRERKSERTKFLNALTNTLILRMDDADEN